MEAVVFCGVQGAGKSTFFRERFFETHVRISRDLLRTPHRESVFLRACLDTRQRFVVDKCNPTPAERAPYVVASRKAGFDVVAFWFDVPIAAAVERNQRRSARARVPLAGLYGTAKALRRPQPHEGFSHIFRVTFADTAFCVEALPTSSPGGHGGTPSPGLD